TEGLTVAANQLLGIDPFVKAVSAITIVFLCFALVGLATGLGALYPRFAAENVTQVAGSYGGGSFMIVAVLFVLATMALVGWPSSVYLLHRAQGIPLDGSQWLDVALSFAAAAAASVTMWLWSMRAGVRALERMG